jgi:hypothetical protein
LEIKVIDSDNQATVALLSSQRAMFRLVETGLIIRNSRKPNSSKETRNINFYFKPERHFSAIKYCCQVGEGNGGSGGGSTREVYEFKLSN